MQYAVSLRTAKQAAIETHIGGSPILEFRTGAPPANCATAASGTLLAAFALPADWLDVPAAGAVGKTGTWQGNAAADIAQSNIGYFRIYKAGSPSECMMQGTVTVTGGGGDMTVDNISVNANQQITVTSFTLTSGNA